MIKHWKAALMHEYLSNYSCTRTESGWKVYNESGKLVGMFVGQEFLTLQDMRKRGLK